MSNSIEIAGFIPLSDGSYVQVEEATPAQVKAAIAATDSIEYRRLLRGSLRWVEENQIEGRR